MAFGDSAGFGGSEGAWGSIGGSLLDIIKPVASGFLDKAINGRPKAQSQAPIVIQNVPPAAPINAAAQPTPAPAMAVPVWAWVAGGVALVGGIVTLAIALRR